MNTMTTYYDQVFSESDSDYSVIIEDDGKVCYAYLLLKSDIIGDVWLYNQAETPERVEWKKENMPFLNPAEFIDSNYKTKPILGDKDVEVRFDFGGGTSLKQVKIHLRGRLLAIIKPDSKPGWSMSIIKDGPLAKKIS